MEKTEKVLKLADLWGKYGKHFRDEEVDDEILGEMVSCEEGSRENRLYKEFIPVASHRLRISRAYNQVESNKMHEINCPYCPSPNEFASVPLYWKHLMVDHEILEYGNFICPFCRVTFDIRTSYRNHVFREKCIEDLQVQVSTGLKNENENPPAPALPATANEGEIM